MKKKEINKIIRNKANRIGALILAGVIAFGGGLYSYESRKDIPELVTFVDSEGTIEITEDETPLGAPKVTKTVKKKKKTKKIKLKQKSDKTYNKAGSTSTKKQTSTKKSGNTTVTTETVVDTSVMSSFKKGSKIEKQTTTTTTTVTKTEITGAASSGTSASPVSVVSATKTTSAAPAVQGTNINIRSLASKADSRVLDAYNSLGFTVTVTQNASYTGLFDARKQLITLKRVDDTVYHELGHFVAFIAGNVDISNSFKAVYAAEKGLYTEYNKAYVTSNSSEYFAESYKNYTLNPAALRASRPQTYAAIEAAVNKITTAQVSRVANTYASIWK